MCLLGKPVNSDYNPLHMTFKSVRDSNRMIRKAIGITAILMLAGCASMISSATARMADNLTTAMLNQNDLETVRAGAPAYLIMIDGMIEGDPGNTDLLLAGSKIYFSYTSAFVDDEERAKRLADKSLNYSRAALCIEMPDFCMVLSEKLDIFKEVLGNTSSKDLPFIYGYASALASWIQANAEDWSAIAKLPQLTVLFERCVELDENFDHGGAHVFLGVLGTKLPPSFGGKPEQGRAHFERAMEISDGKNLMIYVLMAESYARLVFDQELHDELLQTVLDRPANEPGFTLINTLAKQRATVLLEESTDFF